MKERRPENDRELVKQLETAFELLEEKCPASWLTPCGRREADYEEAIGRFLLVKRILERRVRDEERLASDR